MKNALGNLAWTSRHLRLRMHWLLKPYYCAYCVFSGFGWRWDWKLLGTPHFRRHRTAVVEIGRRFAACSLPFGNSLGVFQPVVINAGGRGSVIRIGDDVGASGCTISAALSVVIGNGVLLGSGCLITDSDAHPVDALERARGGAPMGKPVVIEDNVFIGARAIVLKGVRIGRNSVVGAGAVVAKDVPANAVVAGNPARVVKMMPDSGA